MARSWKPRMLSAAIRSCRPTASMPPLSLPGAARSCCAAARSRSGHSGILAQGNERLFQSAAIVFLSGHRKGREDVMAYIKGIEPAEAGWFSRLVYWFVRRSIGKVTGKSRLIEPVKITAHHPRLTWAIGQMEGGVEAARF